MTNTASAHGERLDLARRWSWIGLLAVASLVFSRAFACAMPFAALATLAALNMRRGEAAALMLIVWIVNQAVGYLILHYPRNFESYEWGLAIGVSGFLALGGAMAADRLKGAPAAVLGAAACVLAFVFYEGGLYLNALALREGGAAFTPGIVTRILEVNAAAFAGLLVLDRLAVRVRLIPAHPRPAFA